MRYHNPTMTLRFRHYSQGVALITAMLIVALASIAAVAVTTRQQLDIRRSANLMNGEQSYQFASGVEGFAVQVLADDLNHPKAGRTNMDALDETWAQPLVPQSIEGGQLTGHIEDLQGRFNLNNLWDVANNTTDPGSVAAFERLLSLLDIDASKTPPIVYAVADWIDPNPDVNSNGGAEDGEYLSKTPPYRAANRPMASASELLMIYGIEPADYLKLAPYICALPPPTTINVNTASALVLAAVSNISLTDAEQLVSDRKTTPYAKTGDYTNAVNKFAGSPTGPSPAIDVVSNYFLVTSDTQFGKGRTRLFSEVKRTSSTDIKVILRAQGVL